MYGLWGRMWGGARFVVWPCMQWLCPPLFKKFDLKRHMLEPGANMK